MVTLLLSGDVMTGRGIDQILAQPCDPELHESYVKDARQYVRLAERKNGPIELPVKDDYIWGIGLEAIEVIDPTVRVINLETAVTTSNSFWKGKPVHYRMSPGNVGCLVAARVDCCTLANNHTLDWGYAGLSETLGCLDRAGVKTAGAGPNEKAAMAPAVFSSGTGHRILVFSLATVQSGVPPAWAAAEDRPGIAILPNLSDVTFTRVAETLAAVRRDEADVVVVSIHWGGNWEYDVPAAQQVFAHRLIEEAGAHIVHGHSSHHVEAIEVHRDRLILYGCGDLISDYEGISGRESYRGDLGLMYFADIDPAEGRLTGLRMQPTQVRQMRLCRPSDSNIVWMQDTLDRQSRRFGARVRLESDGLRFMWWTT